MGEVVELRDAIEVDGARSDPQRVAALCSKRSDGEVDDRRRDRDLRVLEPDGTCQGENSLLEIGGRIAGLVPGTREPE